MDASAYLHRQSQGIDALRFLLMVVVVFIHVLPDHIFPVERGLFSGGAYSYISELLSHVIGSAAVPTFFVISGYYALYSRKDYSQWNIFWSELKKKLLSLLSPYLIWAILAIVIVLGKQWLWDVVGIPNTDLLTIDSPYLEKLSRLLWSNVYAYQLWYLRDLICVTLLLPLLYTAIKYSPWLCAIFSILYLLNFQIGISGFSMVALCFFSLGCLLGYYRVALLHWAFKLRYIFIPILLLGLGLPLINQTEVYGHIMRPFIFALIGGFGLLAHYISLSTRALHWLLHLNRYTFFIYCTHTILIISFMRGICQRAFGSLENLGSYIGVAGLTIIVCIILYHVIRWACPRLLSISLGGRL